MIDVLATFISFFSVIDPIGTVPVFVAVTAGFTPAQRRRAAGVAALVSSAVLLFFLIGGEPILDALSIPLPAFQIAGGLVLFLFALTMIFGDSKPDEEIRIAREQDETGIYPLAVPSIASPGAMLAAVLLTDNSKFDVWQQSQTAAVMLSVVAVAYAMMLAAGPIIRFIGRGGASVASRVMGLLLSSVAVDNTLTGVRLYFDL